MPFLTYLDPASVEPTDLVNRTQIVHWLRNNLDSFLLSEDKSRGRSVAIIGERGIGKSMVMQSVISELRHVHSATTLILTVDCRGCASQRRVYHEIARQAVNQIGPRLDAPMLDTARILETIAAQDEVRRSVLAERITEYKSAIKLTGKRNFLGLIGVAFGINLERSKRSREQLEGSISFDGTRLREAIIAFFADLRAHAKLDVIVVLDNLDELRHEAIIDSDVRTWLSGEIDGLLDLVRAPIGFVVTARTYFAGSLNRQIDNTKVLHRLTTDEHIAIIQRRLQREPGAVQSAFKNPESDHCTNILAKRAHTPLSLLSWFRYLAENEQHCDEHPLTSLHALLIDRHANIKSTVIKAVVQAFGGKPYEPVSSEALLTACGQKSAIYKQLLRSQIVLPVDFWDPYEFTLAPELHFMLEA